MSYTISQLIDDINQVIPAVQRELDNRRSGISGNGNEEQLKLIIDELQGLRDKAKSNCLPRKEKRWTAFSRYVIDEWNNDSELGNKLCEIADKYKREIS